MRHSSSIEVLQGDREDGTDASKRTTPFRQDIEVDRKKLDKYNITEGKIQADLSKIDTQRA